MTTWAQVHVGDVVRGADQRGWTVVERGGTRKWASGGNETSFVLRLGEREVRTFRRDAEAVDLLERADHTAEAGALEAVDCTCPGNEDGGHAWECRYSNAHTTGRL